jgi:hypothetical protein
MKRAPVLAIALLATCTGLASAAFAQGTPASRPDRAADKAAPPPQYADSAPDADDNSVQSPVLKVTGVEVMRSAHAPALDVVHVWGVSSTDAWNSPEIVPLTHTPSGDGVLELLFVARSPGEGMDPTPFGKLEAVFIIEPGHPYKAIRVRGASNSLLLAKLPGYVETAAPKQDCTNCIGKRFVAKGAAAPAGVASGDIVNEEDLGAPVRVIKASEGVGKLDTDPNRLTLVVGDDGRIALAIWE